MLTRLPRNMTWEMPSLRAWELMTRRGVGGCGSRRRGWLKSAGCSSRTKSRDSRRRASHNRVSREDALEEEIVVRLSQKPRGCPWRVGKLKRTRMDRQLMDSR